MNKKSERTKWVGIWAGWGEENRIHKTDHRNGKKKLFKLEILYAPFPPSVAFKISDVLKRLKLLIYWR